jgi:hypothetical protein
MVGGAKMTASVTMNHPDVLLHGKKVVGVMGGSGQTPLRKSRRAMKATLDAGYYDSSIPGSRGMEKVNVAPGPSLGSAHRRPRWRSMMDRLTNNPIPIPSLLVV